LKWTLTTYKKVKGTLDPKTPIKITGDKPMPTGSVPGSVQEDGPEAVIEPQDKATIKYLSNVKDGKTGEVSKPFVIGGKNYQMVRGITPSKEVVMAVYCHDELDENGENVIHPVKHFEENIANPMKEQMASVKETGGYDYAGEERAYHDKEAFMDYLNLVGLEGFKHFFVNIKTGEIKAKFKSTKEMIKSGVKLGPDEDYMDAKTLKRYRFGDYFKGGVNEEAPVDGGDGTWWNRHKKITS